VKVTRRIAKTLQVDRVFVLPKARGKKWATVAYRVNGKQEDYSY